MENGLAPEHHTGFSGHRICLMWAWWSSLEQLQYFYFQRINSQEGILYGNSKRFGDEFESKLNLWPSERRNFGPGSSNGIKEEEGVGWIRAHCSVLEDYSLESHNFGFTNNIILMQRWFFLVSTKTTRQQIVPLSAVGKNCSFTQCACVCPRCTQHALPPGNSQ